MEQSKTQQKIKSESFNIEKAINRLQWRFKNENVKPNESKITINELDQKAVDFLLNWITDQKKDELVNNVLFAKLFCYVFENEVRFYKDPKFAIQKIQETLSEPIEQKYNSVHKALNEVEHERFLKSIGIVMDHVESMLLTKSQQETQDKIIKDRQKEIEKSMRGAWSIESVYKSLNNSITECINRFKSKP